MAVSKKKAPTATKLIRAADVKPEKLDFLWLDRIPKGTITLIGGRPGQGKSLFTTCLAAQVTKRGGAVIMSNPEDQLASVKVPRLIAAEADPRLVHFWPGKLRLPGDVDRARGARAVPRRAARHDRPDREARRREGPEHGARAARRDGRADGRRRRRGAPPEQAPAEGRAPARGVRRRVRWLARHRALRARARPGRGRRAGVTVPGRSRRRTTPTRTPRRSSSTSTWSRSTCPATRRGRRDRHGSCSSATTRR